MSEQAKLAAIIRPMLPELSGGHLSDRWASDIADAIIDSGQWVPRSAMCQCECRCDLRADVGMCRGCAGMEPGDDA